MNLGERIKGKFDQWSGRLRTRYGARTRRPRTEAGGIGQELKGDVTVAKAKVGEKVQDIKSSVRHD